MTTSAITANTSASSPIIPNTTNVFTNPKSALNQTDFLKLLVTQIQYQDPMNPQSDTQMAAQMAQFSTLQQSTEMSSSLSMLQANSLVGTTVTVQVDAKTTASGVVTGVTFNGGMPQITVSNKDATTGNVTTANYSLSQVTSVAPTPVTTTAGTTASSPQTTP